MAVVSINLSAAIRACERTLDFALESLLRYALNLVQSELVLNVQDSLHITALTTIVCVFALG